MKHEILKDRVFTISNFLTVSRAFFLPFFIEYAYLYHLDTSIIKYYYILISICGYVVLSDYLDGLIARLLKEETILGRYLDPVSDKIVTIGGLSTITAYFHFPLWILILYIIREIIGVWVGLFLYFKRGLQGKPNIWGKWGVALVAISVVHYLSLPLLQRNYPNLVFTKEPEISGYLLIAVVFIGSVKYLTDYKKDLVKE
ncbi:MAG TPA: CDP-alcohol phosphatidyltransferase family protein [Leptospiraceae bacterium]|nr:CDP-alcohol phosphatidyltransferase family protein [Leptospiraceae bacterium]HMW06672.1 CDP-alcohol phosphatidyltransferase family protein [Leptospiraceae bacterium]HMX34116.1 CDP-alcohol phosphatidyltransferase family protein [Leptospiraceae bacterium]HMY33723.1 CDP-alcohol phosphatidyltransferase family protein [Leptospiraceae bacterium]HMZ64932.1 CDP-alcohol phosphatidyltransferase family protein [Leptospiraceae bacterium]